MGACLGVTMAIVAACPRAWGDEPGASTGASAPRELPGNPTTTSALAAQHRRHLLAFGLNTVGAAGVMTAGVLTRDEPGWRALSVTSATLGGTIGGLALGEIASHPCSAGALCGVGESVTMIVGALLGAAVSFGAGMWLSSQGPGGRVAATGLGVGSYLGVAAYASFNKWDQL